LFHRLVEVGSVPGDLQSHNCIMDETTTSSAQTLFNQHHHGPGPVLLMGATVVVGLQWGDEGKGKITDILAENSDIIVRFQGGNNAGHTIIVGSEEFKFHLLPSGIIHQDKDVILGHGVVVDPAVLCKEMDELTGRGLSIDKLWVSDRANVIMPYHKVQDGLEEEFKGAAKIGTTKRGIGPAYTDKVGRFGIRMGDLVDPELFEEKVKYLLPFKKTVLKAMGSREDISVGSIVEEYRDFARRLKPHVIESSVMINDALDNNKNVLFEGAQGLLLDIDCGTYPYVTSSNTVAGAACVGGGVGPTRIDRVVGIVKAYTTRVGKGPFPTELEDHTAEHLSKIGAEFGTTTGRSRRVGWLDLVALKHAVRLNSVSDLVITKVDVMSGIDEIKVCTEYMESGTSRNVYPHHTRILERCAPVYDTLPGWGKISKKEWADIRENGPGALPENLRSYLDYISRHLKVPVSMVSFGPDRDDTMELH